MWGIDYIIADAVERAGSADPAAIRDALAETNYADHILPYSGPITFDDTGETEVASPVVMQVQEGEVVQVRDRSAIPLCFLG